jgi:hypothetical protein
VSTQEGSTPYPPQLVIEQIGPGEEVTGYRAVHVPDVDDPQLERSFRSHYEMGLEPQPAERQHAAIFMAVSLWSEPEIVARFARRFPVMGAYIARVVMAHGLGLDRLDPSAERNPKHLTVWGTRGSLAASVVEIYPVEGT